LQGLFNGHRFSRILLGRKQVKIIQKNYTPTKVQRILGEPPTREFYTKDFAKYDCVPVEAVLTDSQRQLFYSQLMAYKKMGAPIPWNAMVDYGPMEYKDKFKQIMTQAEKQQSEAAEEERQMNMVAKQLLNAEAAQKIASAKERLSQAQENRTTSELDRAKTIRELQQVDLNSFAKTLALLQQMLGMLKGEQRQPEGGQPGLENIQTIGQA
jgi:hypothetical protein